MVQVSWDDANAYAKWAGSAFPQRQSGSLLRRVASTASTPGEMSFSPKGNTWPILGTDDFPTGTLLKMDLSDRAGEIVSFKRIGLYDMGGNVWNWVSDFYRPDIHVQMASEPACHNPVGPKASWNPGHPNETDEHVTKGGSFLCNPSYCESYRPSARRGTPSDTGMSHIGFRCAKSKHHEPPPRWFPSAPSFVLVLVLVLRPRDLVPRRGRGRLP